ncbi:MAG: BTAD domain-containing putative transcriptional regulator [Actinomycetota bacterium]
MTTALERTVDRPRVVRELLRRFEQRITVITAAAGYGKTTALALAVAHNHLDPLGHDVWLGAEVADGDPLHLLGGLATALDIEPVGDERDTMDRILDAVLSRAPDDVALIVDDVHVLIDTPSVSIVTELLQRLPANGHLVLAGRLALPVPLGRLRAHGMVVELASADLALDDEELGELRVLRSDNDLDDLPRHAATADLHLAAGSSAGVEFLWEEVLSGVEDDRLTALKRAAVLDVLDEHMISELTDGNYDIDTLVAGVPLVEGDRERRMHSLLRDALAARSTPGEMNKALSIAGDVERSRERFSLAVAYYLAAGDALSAHDAARDFALTPTLKQSMEAIAAIRSQLVDLEPTGALTACYEAMSMFGGLENHVVPKFNDVAHQARADDDALLETLAYHRMLQASFIGFELPMEPLVDRLSELATDVPFARGVHAHARSQVAQLGGDPDAAVAALADYHHLGDTAEVVMRAERLCDLGRPEEVAVGLGPDALAGLPPGTEIFIAFAMWLRGESTPEFAEAIVGDMIPTVVRRGLTHPTVSILGVGTTIALAAGDVAAARRRAERAREVSELGVGATIGLFASVAEASVAAVTQSDEVAAQILAPEQTGLAITVWPLRGHLLALPLIYVTRPETRDVLNRCAFGHSLNTAVSAGRALVAARDGEVEPAGRLPWGEPNLLRVHVLPHHLAELGCAALAAGNSSAMTVLEQLPDRAVLLRRVADSAVAPTRAVAEDLLGTLPRRADYDYEVRLLGAPQLVRDGAPVDDPDWVRRPQVQLLFAALLEHRRMHRHDLIEMLWPDHGDDAKAGQRLRTALSMLTRILEPDRDTSTPALVVRTEGDHVVVDDSVRTDVSRFEELAAAARSDDQAGLPRRALRSYEAAADTYRGDYLDGIDAGWAVFTRLRLRSLAMGAMCRIAELTAASGEPELAASWAERARRIDPFNERAARTFVQALGASGDRTGALLAAHEFVNAQRAAGLEPTPETLRVIERLEGR